MNRKTRLILLLIAGCLTWLSPPSPGCAEERAQPREEYLPSRSGATTTTLRLTLSPASARAGPVVPKTLPELRRVVGDGFLCVQRGNFLVAGDLNLLDYEYLVDGVLDYCAKALVKTFFDKGTALDKSVNIFVFKDYESYETGVRRMLGMEPISPYGHYGHTQKYIVINYETGPGTMVHELTHALMSEDFPGAPIWLAEGIASLYEHCVAEGNMLKGDDNWRLPELQAALRAGTLTPLAALVSMTPEVFRGRNESLNYAQSRYFCKYLEQLGLLPRVYKELRDGAARDPTGEEVLARILGKPLEAVEAAWKRWVAFQYWRE